MMFAVHQARGRARRIARLFLLLVLLAASVAASQGAGEPLRAGDAIRVVVPERPDLEQDLTVDVTGAVELPQVGEVQLAGLSLDEAAELLKQRLRLIHPNLENLSLELASSGQVRIYVLGQVAQAGVVTFDRVPGIWDVLRSAGGPLDEADLKSARIIREGQNGPEVLPIDLSGVLEGGGAPDLELQDSDTLIVPRAAAAVTELDPEVGVRVFGGVFEPMVIDIDEPTQLVDVLMMAGAPTGEANLKTIWWVHRENGRPQATLVNLQNYLSNADPLGNPMIHPGDVVNVTYQRPGFLARYLPLFLGVATATSAVYLAFTR